MSIITTRYRYIYIYIYTWCMCEYAQKAKPDGLLLGRDPAVLCEEPHVLGVFVSEARATHARP